MRLHSDASCAYILFRQHEPWGLWKGIEMELIFKRGAVEIWSVDGEFYVYGVTRDPRVCQSLGMAREFAAAAL